VNDSWLNFHNVLLTKWFITGVVFWNWCMLELILDTLNILFENLQIFGQFYDTVRQNAV